MNKTIIVAVQLLTLSAVAFAEPVMPINFDGGPGCGTLDFDKIHKALITGPDGAKSVPGTLVLADLQDKGPIVDPEPAAEERLEDAKTQLKAIIADYNNRIAGSGDAAAVSLYKMRDKAQWALDQVNMALEKLAKDRVKNDAKNDKQAKLDSLLGQAAFMNKILASFLGNPDFADTIHMKSQAFQLEVGGDAIFEAVRKRVPFLGGAVQGRIRINPGAEMVSQFNALKAEYYTTLLEAAQALKDMGKKPSEDKRLAGMAKWGNDTKVINPGQGWQDATEILDYTQYNGIVR